MTWLGILIAVVAAVALLSVLGLRPKGGRPVENTGLMSAARVVLVMLAAILVYLAWSS